MALTKEEEDRLKFTGQGVPTQAPPNPLQALGDTLKQGFTVAGQGVQQLAQAPGKLWQATAIPDSWVQPTPPPAAPAAPAPAPAATPAPVAPTAAPEAPEVALTPTSVKTAVPQPQTSPDGLVPVKGSWGTGYVRPGSAAPAGGTAMAIAPSAQARGDVSTGQPIYQQVRDRHEGAKASAAELAALDPRAGWGWKSRQNVFKMGQEADLAQRQQSGAMDRELVQQQGQMDRQRLLERAALQREVLQQTAATGRQQAGFFHDKDLKKTTREQQLNDQETLRRQGLEDKSAERQFQIYKETGDPKAAAALGSGSWQTDYNKAQAFTSKSQQPHYRSLDYTDPETGEVKKRIVDQNGLPLPDDLLDDLLK